MNFINVVENTVCWLYMLTCHYKTIRNMIMINSLRGACSVKPKKSIRFFFLLRQSATKIKASVDSSNAFSWTMEQLNITQTQTHARTHTHAHTRTNKHTYKVNSTDILNASIRSYRFVRLSRMQSNQREIFPVSVTNGSTSYINK